MPPADDEDQRKRRQARWLAEAWSLAWLFPMAIVAGLGIGWWLDKLFGTKPWLTAVFGAFGVIAAFVHLFRLGTRDDGTSK